MANGVKDRFMGSAAAASGEYLSERCPTPKDADKAAIKREESDACIDSSEREQTRGCLTPKTAAKLRRLRVTCKYSAGYSRREKILENGIVRLFCRCHFVFQRVTA